MSCFALRKIKKLFISRRCTQVITRKVILWDFLRFLSRHEHSKSSLRYKSSVRLTLWTWEPISSLSVQAWNFSWILIIFYYYAKGLPTSSLDEIYWSFWASNSKKKVRFSELFWVSLSFFELYELFESQAHNFRLHVGSPLHCLLLCGYKL